MLNTLNLGHPQPYQRLLGARAEGVAFHVKQEPVSA